MYYFYTRLKKKIISKLFYENSLGSCGKEVSLFFPLRIDGGKKIRLGNRVAIQANTWLYAHGDEASVLVDDGSVLGHNNHITAMKEVCIGKKVLTANNVYISDNLHSYEDIENPIIDQPIVFSGKVELGDGCWIGENVSIIGAKVGKNSVIGANSVVTKDVPDYSVAVGAPARVIKKYCFESKVWKKVGEE